MRRLWIFLLVVFAVFTATITVIVLDHGSKQPLGSTLVAGIVASLVASLIVSAVQIFGSRQPPQSPFDPHISGLIKLTTKGRVEPEEWLRLLEKAQKELYIAGHSLGKWCSASNAETFKSHVARIVSRGGQVTLIMLDPESEQIQRLQRATAVDYTGKIGTSRTVLGQLLAELPPEAKRYLRVLMLPDHLSLPYMVAGNENTLVTAAYLSSSDSDSVPCAVLERSCEAASAVFDDFSELAAAGVPVPFASVAVAVEPPSRGRRLPWSRRRPR